MTIEELRAERQRLEQQLTELFASFKASTGFGVVAVELKTVMYSYLDPYGCTNLSRRVFVELERI